MAPVHAQQATVTWSIVDFGAPAWKYQIVAHDALPNFQDPTVNDNDGTWSIGDAAFGTPGACPLNTDGTNGGTGNIRTNWPRDFANGGNDILLRTHLSVPPNATNMRIIVPIDNDVEVWLNGGDPLADTSGVSGMRTSEQCATLDASGFPGQYTFVVPDSRLQANDLVLALRGRDRMPGPNDLT